jgi:hypothetical protein
MRVGEHLVPQRDLGNSRRNRVNEVNSQHLVSDILLLITLNIGM